VKKREERQKHPKNIEKLNVKRKVGNKIRNKHSHSQFDIIINCNWVVTRWQYTFTHRTTQITNRTTQITANVEECGPCPVFASFTLALALQLRKKHGKPSVRLRKTSVRVQYTYYQNTHTLQNPHTHTLQKKKKKTTTA
jgi:hypothetical protein